MAPKAPPLTKKLLAIDGCWGRKSVFSLGQVARGTVVDLTVMHKWAALIGAIELFKKADLKLEGKEIYWEKEPGGVEGRK